VHKAAARPAAKQVFGAQDVRLGHTRFVRDLAVAAHRRISDRNFGHAPTARLNDFLARL